MNSNDKANGCFTTPGRMTGVVKLSSIKLYAYHGVMPQERKVGNYFTVDVAIEYDALQAMIEDNVEKAVSYADIFEVVKAEMDIPSSLIENVCWRIAHALQDRFSGKVTAGEVTVTKLCPPMGCELAGASFTYRW